MKRAKTSLILGIIISTATFYSLFLPWWSIRASGGSIDIYPFWVNAVKVSDYDRDWVIDRLLALNGALLIIGLLVVVSSSLVLIGSVKRPFLLGVPVVLNLAAAFLFHKLMWFAIGSLAYGYFSGTNLVPVGHWGFAGGIYLCIFAGLASPIPLILAYWERHNQLKRLIA